MDLLIVAATSSEIARLRENCEFRERHSNVWTTYDYNGHRIDFLITGVGITATAFHLGKVLTQRHYDLAFNLGVAGSFESFLKKGDVVNVIQEQFADLGAEDGDDFLTLTDLDLQEEDEFPFQGEKLVNPQHIELPVAKDLPKVRGITVNTVSGKSTSIEQMKQRFQPEVESMEGAAFFYGCLHEEQPFLQLRGIANLIEPRNRSNWDIPLAIEEVNEICLQILEHLPVKAVES